MVGVEQEPALAGDHADFAPGPDPLTGFFLAVVDGAVLSADRERANEGSPFRSAFLLRRPTAGHRGPWLRPCRPLRARRRCRWLRCRPGAGARRARSLRATETNGSGCWWAARCRHVQCPQLAAVDRRSIGVVIQPSRLVRAIPTRCCRRRPSAPPDGHREGACERCPSDPRPPTRLRVRSTGRVSRCPSGVWCLKETERTLSQTDTDPTTPSECHPDPFSHWDTSLGYRCL